MSDEAPSGAWYESADGLVAVPALVDPSWETTHERGGEPPSIASAVKRKRAVSGQIMFMMAKQYTVDPKHVLPAERLVREVYPQSYAKRFQSVDYGPVRDVALGGRTWWQAEMRLVHERIGPVTKVERTFVQGTSVFVLSAEGQPDLMAAHVDLVQQWLHEARFRDLEHAALHPDRNLVPLVEALGGASAAGAAVAPPSPQPDSATGGADAFMATMASDGPPPGLLDGILLEQSLPVVHPHDWPDRGTAVHRSLCWLPRVAGTPWLGFQIVLGSTTRTVSREDLDRIGVAAEQLEKAAIRNLSRTRASWVARKLPGPGGKEVEALFCQESPHACERILERPFLLHGKAMLHADQLSATVPQRGLLVVARFDDFGILMALARHLHQKAPPRDRLSPWVFAIQGGEITGRFFEENGQVGLDAVVAKR